MLQTTLKVSEISIDDKEYFDKYFEMANLQVSELNFTNFFIWRDYYKVRYIPINNFLCIMSIMDDKKPFCFFPIGDYNNREELRTAIYTVKEYFLEKGWELQFRRVAAQQISALESLDIKFNVQEDRDNFDYIYSVQKLSTLAGKKLDGKRNHINKFKKLHTFEYVEISDENISDCIDIVEKWCLQRNYSEDSSLIAERKANLDLLNNFNSLRLTGAIIKVDGKPEAVTVGEKLNKDTVVIHVEKANSEVHGLYTLVNQQFLANHWNNFEYVNREQDLGLEGLRKAKLSYNPASLVEKFTVELC